jgi:translin
MQEQAAGNIMENMEKEIEKISDLLSKKQSEFDKVMQLSRDIIRASGQAITTLHNGHIEKAERMVLDIKSKISELGTFDMQFKYNSFQAYQEYAEAAVSLSIKKDGRIPSIKEVGVDAEAYLMGLMDSVGELKREVLESLRGGKIKEAEKYFEFMEEIYDSTRTMRFAEAVLNGFRKKQDTARIQIENAGSEILMFKSREAPSTKR